MKINIVIIDDRSVEFSRLNQHLAARCPGVNRIYSCRFASDFFKISGWQDYQLVISANQIGGRKNAGLQFFQELYTKHVGHSCYGLLMTRPPQQAEEFCIRTHALNYRHPRFLGAVFRQIGDVDKVREVVQAVIHGHPYAIFDRPMLEDEYKATGAVRRLEAEHLLSIQCRIQERMLFFVQLVRHHLHQQFHLDFRQTMQAYPDYRDGLLQRFKALVSDIEELIDLIETNDALQGLPETSVVREQISFIEPALDASQPQGRRLHALLATCITAQASVSPAPSADELRSSLREFIKFYEDLVQIISRFVTTAQIALNHPESSKRGFDD